MRSVARLLQSGLRAGSPRRCTSWSASPAGHPVGRPKRRYAHDLQQVVPKHAERILNDPSWDALATVLAEAETVGHTVATVLGQALSQGTLDDARSPARALTWRIRRLGERQAPGLRARAANARPTAERPAAPPPQDPQARRR
ncbi:hypothetical protein [Streptomyces violaceus]|uniref:hypothetical protein n=1 Tax=Streptomyces violaceus TaxID=1936 RepID=UPI002E1EF670